MRRYNAVIIRSFGKTKTKLTHTIEHEAPDRKSLFAYIFKHYDEESIDSILIISDMEA